MCEKLQKIEQIKKLLEPCCGTCAEKLEIQNLVRDLELLVKSEKAYEQAWEMTSMAIFGTDGLGGMKRVASKSLETLELISCMTPEMAASMAPNKAKLALQLISEEKVLARGVK